MAIYENRTSKKGEKKILARVRLSGFPPVSATFDKKREAISWASKIETEMKEGRYDSHTLARRYSLKEAVERYIDNVLPIKSKKARYLVQQKKQLRWWSGAIGAYKLINVTPALISEQLVNLRKIRSAGTCNRYLAALSHVMTYLCKEWGWLSDNPISKLNKFKEPRGRVRFLTEAEREALFKACYQSRCKDLFIVMLLAISTGARKSEILNLGWENYDIQRNQIAVLETKNDERRTLYLRGKACYLFYDRYVEAGEPESGLVFKTRNNLPIRIDEPWQTALRRAGIKDFRFHDLRHTAASYLAMNGTSTAAIAELLGHKTLDMVKRYAHLSESHTAAQVEQMNKLFE